MRKAGRAPPQPTGPNIRHLGAGEMKTSRRDLVGTVIIATGEEVSGVIAGL